MIISNLSNDLSIFYRSFHSTVSFSTIRKEFLRKSIHDEYQSNSISNRQFLFENSFVHRVLNTLSFLFFKIDYAKLHNNSCGGEIVHVLDFLNFKPNRIGKNFIPLNISGCVIFNSISSSC